MKRSFHEGSYILSLSKCHSGVCKLIIYMAKDTGQFLVDEEKAEIAQLLSNNCWEYHILRMLDVKKIKTTKKLLLISERDTWKLIDIKWKFSRDFKNQLYWIKKKWKFFKKSDLDQVTLRKRVIHGQEFVEAANIKKLYSIS